MSHVHVLIMMCTLRMHNIDEVAAKNIMAASSRLPLAVAAAELRWWAAFFGPPTSSVPTAHPAGPLAQPRRKVRQGNRKGMAGKGSVVCKGREKGRRERDGGQGGGRRQQFGNLRVATDSQRSCDNHPAISSHP